MSLDRLKIQEESILSMKIRADNIDLVDAECFNCFPSISSNCKIIYCCFEKAEQY